MKIHKNTRRLPLVLLLALVVSGVGIAGYFLYFKEGAPFNAASTTDKPSINYDTPSDGQVAAGNDAKKDAVNSSDTDNSADDPKQPSDPPSTESSLGKTAPLGHSITVREVNNSTLYVRNEIEGVYSSGTCVLILTKNGRTITKKSGVQALAQVSTCRGFNVPTSELSQGTWNITLTVTIGNKKSTSKGSVNI